MNKLARPFDISILAALLLIAATFAFMTPRARAGLNPGFMGTIGEQSKTFAPGAQAPAPFAMPAPAPARTGFRVRYTNPETAASPAPQPSPIPTPPSRSKS